MYNQELSKLHVLLNLIFKYSRRALTRTLSAERGFFNVYRGVVTVTDNLKYKHLNIALISLVMIFLNAAALLAGDATLSWDPPATNSDETALTDLAGYKIYYGTASGSYTDNIDVGNVTTYQLTDLTDGLTYYFAVTAYDTSQNESDYSNEVSKTIGTGPPPPPEPEITVTDSVTPAGDLQVPFGDITEGNSSDQTVTATNDGNADIIISNIAQANPLTAPFSIINDNCSGQTVAPMANCTVTIRFSPVAAGIFNDSFDIPSNDSDENPVTITVSGTGLANNPPAADTDGPYTGIEGQTITLDGSGSTDSDGSIVLYEWDIDNDGTYDYSSSSATRNHTYTRQGTYTIKLRITDNLGATDEATTTAAISDTSPTADFTGSPTSGTTPLTVNFTGNSTGYDRPLSYEWDFDNDGIIDSTGLNPSYTYSDQGTYTVKLAVTDSDGSANTLSRTDYITVTLPVYSLTVNVNGNGTVISSPSGIDCPGDCSEQYMSGVAVTLTAEPQTGYLLDNWSDCSNSNGNECTVTMNTDTSVTATFTADEKILSCADAGSIKCLERTDGGSDSDNLDNDVPKVDIEYEFRITLQDTSGNAPQYIKLYMTQRSNPEAGEFYAYDMNCSGDYSTGGLCTYTTKLGAASVHEFYFGAKMFDGTLLRYPDTGYITGPEVRLITGYNMVGMPRDIGYDILDGSTAFGSASSYRWDADLGYYTDVTTAEPVKSGEGYFVKQESGTLPELAEYGEITDTEFIYELKYGWNIISNPYAGNVRLLDINVRKGSDTEAPWTEATSNGWLTNAIYYFNGTDWGDTYGFETEPDATLVPWMGYWMYLEATDDTYYIVIPKP